MMKRILNLQANSIAGQEKFKLDKLGQAWYNTHSQQHDKGNTMRHDETRDNTTAIENQIIEADKRAREESAPYPPAYPFPVFGGEPAEKRHEDTTTWSECECEDCTGDGSIAAALFAQPHFGG